MKTQLERPQKIKKTTAIVHNLARKHEANNTSLNQLLS